jgi:ketosteroid isomerase-like protein
MHHIHQPLASQSAASQPLLSVIITYVAETDLDTIRASYGALNQGNVQGALDALHRDAVWRESPELPGGDEFEGRAAIEEFLEGYLEQWEIFHQQVESTLHRDDRVLVNIRLTAVGRESGAEVSARYAHVWTIREGRGARVDAYYDPEKALREFEA